MDSTNETQPSAGAEDAILAVAQATAPTMGEAYFKALVQNLTQTLGVRATLLTEIIEPERRRVRGLAMWDGERLVQPPDRDLEGTITERIITNAVSFWPVEMQANFPAMRELAAMSVQSCIGVRMSDITGKPIGALMIMSERPIQLSPLALAMLQMFAARAGGELERGRYDASLRENEAMFRTIDEAVPGILYMCDAVGRVTYISQQGLELTGTPLDEIRGLGWRRLLHPEDRDRTNEAWSRCVATGEPFDSEQRLRVADGGYRWFANRFRPHRDEAGRIVRWFGVCTDIDAVMRAQETEREMRAQMQLVLAQVPAAVWTTDRELRYSFRLVSPLVGQTRLFPKLEGMTVAETTGDGPHDAELLKAHQRALAGAAGSYEAHGDGRSFHGHVEPIRDAAGQISGVAGVALDVTDRKRAETALQTLNQELEERVRRATAELLGANAALRREIAERRATEEALRQSEARAQKSAEREREAARRAFEAADSNRLLVRELDHRVRNNLAALITLVDAMRRGGGSVDDFASNMHSRLLAMANAHQTIAEAGGRSTDLRTLCGSLLDAICGTTTSSISVNLIGPPVAVAPRQVTPLAMILQEWCTNSGKYGAHSAPGAALHVNWNESLDGKGRRAVSLTWRESGGPAPRLPIRPSLGTELVKAFAQIELGGRLTLNYPETGAEHELVFPAD